MKHRDYLIDAPTLFQAWEQLNRRYLWHKPDDGNSFHYSGSSNLGISHFHILLSGTRWGLPPPDDRYLHLNSDRRTKLLWRRYGETSYPREAEKLKRFAEKVMFRNKKVTKALGFEYFRPLEIAPNGGGCLYGIGLYYDQAEWNIRLYARASEVTYSLLGDIYFYRHTVRLWLREAEIIDRIEPFGQIDFSILHGSQSRVQGLYFLAEILGLAKTFDYLTEPPVNPWQKTLQEYFWRRYYEPTNFKLRSIRTWAERFHERLGTTPQWWQERRSKKTQCQSGTIGEDRSFT